MFRTLGEIAMFMCALVACVVYHWTAFIFIPCYLFRFILFLKWAYEKEWVPNEKTVQALFDSQTEENVFYVGNTSDAIQRQLSKI